MTVVITAKGDGSTDVSVSDGAYQEKVRLLPGEFLTLIGDKPRVTQTTGATGDAAQGGPSRAALFFRDEPEKEAVSITYGAWPALETFETDTDLPETHMALALTLQQIDGLFGEGDRIEP